MIALLQMPLPPLLLLLLLLLQRRRRRLDLAQLIGIRTVVSLSSCRHCLAHLTSVAIVVPPPRDKKLVRHDHSVDVPGIHEAHGVGCALQAGKVQGVGNEMGS